MNPNNFLSQPLCQWLKENGCEIPASYWWREENNKWSIGETVTYIPAYSWLDVLVWKAKEFFGEEESDYIWKYNGDKIVRRNDQTFKNYQYHTQQILSLLQQGKTEEAEAYFKEHTIFNK